MVGCFDPHHIIVSIQLRCTNLNVITSSSSSHHRRWENSSSHHLSSSILRLRLARHHRFWCSGSATSSGTLRSSLLRGIRLSSISRVTPCGIKLLFCHTYPSFFTFAVLPKLHPLLQLHSIVSSLSLFSNTPLSFHHPSAVHNVSTIRINLSVYK